jgi:hypothetical protein
MKYIKTYEQFVNEARYTTTNRRNPNFYSSPEGRDKAPYTLTDIKNAADNFFNYLSGPNSNFTKEGYMATDWIDDEWKTDTTMATVIASDMVKFAKGTRHTLGGHLPGEEILTSFLLQYSNNVKGLKHAQRTFDKYFKKAYINEYK